MSTLLTATILLACALAGLLDRAEANATGAPAGACTSMMPSHNGVPAQQGTVPFTIGHNIPDVFQPMTEYTVTISSNPATTIRGIFCQVREPGDSTRVYGLFKPRSSSLKAGACTETFSGTAGEATITHSERLSGNSIAFGWTSPSNGTTLPANLHVVCTVVHMMPTFWVQIPSTNFSAPASPSTAASSSVTVPYNTSATAATTAATTATTYTGTTAVPATTSTAAASRVTTINGWLCLASILLTFSPFTGRLLAILFK
ncbi:putative defense protein 3 [Sycon ciliatum]|uniref:putative defense protein 3 n=1 Tax=Sycon ciliatum TaxID=27933 RepID=UPI0031F679FF